MRALRSLAVLLFLSSVACSWNEPREDGCSGCTSAHGSYSYGGTPARTERAAAVSRLVLGDGSDFTKYYLVEVRWEADGFSLLGAPLPISDATDAGAANGVDAGAAGASEEDGGASDASSDDAEAGLEDAGTDAATLVPRDETVEAGPGDAGLEGARVIARVVESGEEERPDRRSGYGTEVSMRLVVCTTPLQRLVDGRCRDVGGGSAHPGTVDVTARRSGESGQRFMRIDHPRLALSSQEIYYPATNPAGPFPDCY